MTGYPRVDDDLATEVLDALGVSSHDDVATVLSAFRRWIPAGSVAKWAAVDEGDVPPGEDPGEALRARLAGSTQSWTCWPLCTGLGAVLASRGHDVAIAVEQKRGARAPAIDFHAILVVDGALVDPFLGPSLPVALGSSASDATGWAEWIAGPDGRRHDHLGTWGGRGLFWYRLLADRLGRREVATFCALSVHMGDPTSAWSHVARADGLHAVRGREPLEAEYQVASGADPWTATRRVVDRGIRADLVDRLLTGVGVSRSTAQVAREVRRSTLGG